MVKVSNNKVFLHTLSVSGVVRLAILGLLDHDDNKEAKFIRYIACDNVYSVTTCSVEENLRVAHANGQHSHGSLQGWNDLKWIGTYFFIKAETGVNV